MAANSVYSNRDDSFHLYCHTSSDFISHSTACKTLLVALCMYWLLVFIYRGKQ